jgi:hypothetical protein
MGGCGMRGPGMPFGRGGLFVFFFFWSGWREWRGEAVSLL